MARPSVSVIIPTHDVREYLEECLASVVRQTLPDLEVICVDDASTDDTLDIIGRFAAEHGRIVVVPLTRRSGAGVARNVGLERARGHYVAFLDGDDLYPDPTSVERLYEKAVAHRVDICGGSLFTFHARKIDRCVPLQHFTSEGLRDFRDYQYEGGFYRYIFKRDFLATHGLSFPAYRRHQDSVFLVRAMTTARIFYAVIDHVYAYRKGHKAVTWDADTAGDHFRGIRDILSLARRHNLATLYNRMVRNLGRSLRTRLPTKKDTGFFARFDDVFDACLRELADGRTHIDLPLADAVRSGLMSLACRTQYAAWRLLARHCPPQDR